ncbi:MAG TPA: GNAT family N-acetyltransferase [Bacteroidales bacterium]|nr:GNAT family N-acetyltransferase [Bacteroidales bacterium]
MVFINEQGVDPALEYQGDDEALHYLIKNIDKYIATARWRKTDSGVKLERFAVLPDYRNTGVGKVILDAVLKDVKPLKSAIYLHAQEKAVNFYLKNNFIVEGNMFMEAGIKHYKMVYGG